MVLNKSIDLTDGLTDVKKFRKPAAEIKEYRLTWNKKMKEMEKIGYSRKELESCNVESTKLKDLEFLQKQPIPGPMTTRDKVVEFMESEPESIEKNQRMYREVRFQRLSSQSLKKDAAVFRLKRDGRNLPTKDYADNLCVYLDQSRNSLSLTLSDLRNVLTGLTGASGIQNEYCAERIINQSHDSDDSDTPSFHIGEHIAAVWYDDDSNTQRWHLGVVDGTNNAKQLVVSYMKMSDKKGQKWLFPDKADIHVTSVDQINKQHKQLMYSLTAAIRCEITSATLEQINEYFLKVI
jgi:hypothetical protein